MLKIKLLFVNYVLYVAPIVAFWGMLSAATKKNGDTSFQAQWLFRISHPEQYLSVATSQ